MVIDQGSCSDGDGSFFVPGSIVCISALELPNVGDGAGEEDATVRPFGFPGFFERFEISSDGRFAHPGGFPQVGDRDEAMLANQFAQLGASSRRALGAGGGGAWEIHQEVDGILSKTRW